VRKPRRSVYIVVILVFMVYVAWIMGPYLRSVIVRDAAVTSWLNVATAPIYGTLEFDPQSADGVVGPSGVIVRVRNNLLSRKDLTAAQIKVDHASARVNEYRAFLEGIIEMDQERAELKSRYADTFRAELDAQIFGMTREIDVTNKRLAIVNKIADRQEKLYPQGGTSQAAAEEAWLRVSSLEWQLVQLQKDLEHAKVRRQAANHGAFITPNGDDPDWVRGERMELKLQKKNVRLELRQAEADLAIAQAALVIAKEDYARLSEGFVSAPPGSIVWSEKAAPGATVREGDPIAEWLDCSVLLIDVPVADAEVSLIKTDMEAEIILEGSSTVRTGRVLSTRGSAFTLGKGDLAALAKGRRNGVAQVLLDFSRERQAPPGVGAGNNQPRYPSPGRG